MFIPENKSRKEYHYLQLKEISGKGLSDKDIDGDIDQEFTVLCQVDYMRYTIQNIQLNISL